MKEIPVSDAALKLEEIVRLLPTKGDVVLTQGDEPVARLTRPEGQASLRDLNPSSVGALLRPLFGGEDDLLGEMLDT